MNETNQFFGRGQRGVVTVFTAIVFLVAVTLVVLFTAQTGILEQRMSANELRMKQTAFAAQGGVERAMAHMQISNTPDDLRPDADENGRATYRTVFLTLDVAGETFSGLDDLCPALPTATFPTSAVEGFRASDLREAVILSCGWSDDRSSRKAIMVSMRAGPTVASEPDVPFIARGMVDFRGNANIYNAYRDQTIRTGSEPIISGNAAGLYTRFPGSEPPALSDPVPPPGDDFYDRRSMRDRDHRAREGSRELFEDKALQIGEDEFFEGFLGMGKSDYRETMVSHSLNGGNISIDESMWGQVTWVDGSARLDGSVGSRENPAVVIVDGNLTVRGNFEEFHGILYVTGDLTARGNPVFYGSVIVEGDGIFEETETDIFGTPSFIFDPLAVQRAGGSGIRSADSGSWRDWISTD
ncbi:pilus assembly PilX N-terminal domain-containing protein [Methylonatrum kenyense]|uniref:pilus assembly PilX family protein n=1 Tax=Methylonatrum kenyense TaxID=455253 RepID=UPI0020BEAB8A|nr:PilX N-terminal domain-containing pilus assembly protein [Methylonatrum kenyense]MCK8517108.1 pilus assembly PilX N-terminal domain-containing protein [Methylonatrum kenyense]